MTTDAPAPSTAAVETDTVAATATAAAASNTVAPPATEAPSHDDASGLSRPGGLEHTTTVPIDTMSETGEEMVTKEKLLPKVKQVSKCSYCEINSAESLKTVPCLGCGSRCHIDCISCTAGFKDKILLGDDFFHFKCFKCTDGQERFKRYHLSWVDVVHITL
ncbi:transcription factor, contains a PHD finger motif, partial [Kickxella alabastrina]